MKKTTVTQVPYDKDGNLIRDGGRYYWAGDVEWRPNVPFTERLTVLHIVMGSDSHIWLRDAEGHRFPMWTEDLVRVLHAAGGPDVPFIGSGLLVGRWMVAKRGFMYGLRLAEKFE